VESLARLPRRATSPPSLPCASGQDRGRTRRGPLEKLGSVACALGEPCDMSATALFAPMVFVLAAIGAVAVALASQRTSRPERLLSRPDTGATVGVGTVRAVAEAAECLVVDVESVSGERFVGRLRRSADPVVSTLRPGVVVLVAFDPDVRERLTLADDIAAVRAEFDRMLIGKGLLTTDKLDLIRYGIRSRGVVTGMRHTGTRREDHCEVDVDLMVRRPGGGQFPAHDRTLVPTSSVAEVEPGCVVDAYYRRDDESVVAVCVPPC
jgi:hypothetical protein